MADSQTTSDTTDKSTAVLTDYCSDLEYLVIKSNKPSIDPIVHQKFCYSEGAFYLDYNNHDLHKAANYQIMFKRNAHAQTPAWPCYLLVVRGKGCWLIGHSDPTCYKIWDFFTIRYVGDLCLGAVKEAMEWLKNNEIKVELANVALSQKSKKDREFVLGREKWGKIEGRVGTV